MFAVSPIDGKAKRMNLNEKCLLRYLKYPDELSFYTEILKLNNKIMEQKFVTKHILSGLAGFDYANQTE